MRSTLRNVWFWVAVVFLVANVAIATAWRRSLARRAPATVLGIQPEELGTTRTPISLAFTRDMVPEPVSPSPVAVPWISLTPSARLEGRWASPRTLELWAEDGLEFATEYTLEVAEGVVDADGFPVRPGPALTFRTPALSLQRMHQVALSRDWELTIALEFNDKVPLGELDRRLRVTDDSGTEVPMERLEGGDVSRRVRYRSDGRRRGRVKVRLEPGLVGVSGPLGIEEPVERMLTVQYGLGLNGVHPEARGPERGVIWLDFSMGVDAETLVRYLEIEPEVEFDVERRGSRLGVVGKFRPGARYRLELRSGMPGEAGRFLADDLVRTVRMPDLSPSLDFVGEGVYLSRRGSQTLLVRSVNVDRFDVDVFRIYPNNVVHFLHSRASSYGHDIVENRPVTVSAAKNDVAFTRLDLRDLVGEGRTGPFSIRLRARGHRWTHASKTVTITDLGIHVKKQREDFLVWVVGLTDGRPVEGADVRVFSRANQQLFAGRTDADGLVRFDPGTVSFEELGEPYAVTAETLDDLAYVGLNDGRVSVAGLEVGGRPYAMAAYEAFVYPEREVVRPGEALHLRGIVREPSGALPPEGMPVVWDFTRPDSRPAGTLEGRLTRYGTVEAEWAAESVLPTGRYRAALRLPGDGGEILGTAVFRVEEFMPVTLRVTLEAVERRYAGGEPLVVTVRAEHLFGGAASGLRATARCQLRPAAFEHADWPGVAFTSGSGKFKGSTLKADPIELDANGEGSFTFDIPAELDARSALRALVTVSVHEISGRARTARLARDVDPLPLYLGVVRPEDHGRAGEPYEIQCIALEPDGQPVSLDEVEARLVRVTYEHSLERSSGHYRWVSHRREKEVLAKTISFVDGRCALSITPRLSGRHELVLSAPRGKDRTTARAELSFHVEGEGGGSGEGGPLEIPNRIALTPDRSVYRAGETARIRVESPISGTALLTLESDRIHEIRRFELREATTTLEVPVLPAMTPHGYATLTVIRGLDSPQNDIGVPMRAYGAVALEPDPAARRAEIALELPPEVRPGETIELAMTVTRPDGRPVDGEVAVALVDAGILALTPYRTPDPLGHFLSRRALPAQLSDLFAMIVPEPGDLLARAAPQAGGGARGGSVAAYLNPVSARRVRSVSMWLGGLVTDAEGRVSASVEAPEFDGELVAIALVAGRESVGVVRDALKVRRPVIVQPSWPRFLAVKDRFRVPVTLHNRSVDEVGLHVELALDERLAHVGEEGAERKLVVAAGEQETLWFEVEARDVGATLTEVRCDLGDETIVKTTEIPVRPAAPPVRTDRSYIVGPEQAVILDNELDCLESTQTARLVVSTSLLPNLEGSLRYLLRYPYGCVEQTSSRLVPWIALRDYTRAMRAVGSPEGDMAGDTEIEDHVAAGVERLFSMQCADGGLSYWPGGQRSYPWGSLYAALVLLEARAAGHDVPATPLDALLDYIDELLIDPGRRTDDRQKMTLRAHAVAVLARANRIRRGWIQTLLERRDDLSEESRARVFLAAMLGGIPAGKDGPGRRAGGEGPSLEGFERELGGTLYSRTRELCILLSTLLDMRGASEEVFPLLKALLDLQEDGRYRSTQEDAFAILAFSKAARVFPPPESGVTVVLSMPGREIHREVDGERLELSFSGAEMPREIRVVGEGTVYAFWHKRGVPVSGAAVDEDRGIAVRRSFETLDGKAIEGTTFSQGEPVVVRLDVRAPRRLENVVVVDALPAGFEIENPELSGTDGRSRRKGGLGVLQTSLRDDRLLLFADASEGLGTYRYIVRAVTPGRYRLPPVAAECMYDSAVHSVHGGGEVEVVP